MRPGNFLSSRVSVAVVSVVTGTLAPSLSTAQVEAPLPVVSPAPQDIRRAGPDVLLPDTVRVVTSDDTDPAAIDLLRQTLRAHDVRAARQASLTIDLGPATRPDVASALRDTPVPDHAEGSALRVGRNAIAIGGTDAAGQYYGVQTFRQLFVDGAESPACA